MRVGLKPGRSILAVIAMAGTVAVGLLSARQAPAQRRPSLGVDVISGSSQGLAIAPVPLDLRGKNRFLVGLGSYIVNGSGACVGCHTNPEFAPGGDPFRGQPEKVNTTNYLAGGAKFGPFTSRNL